MADERSRRLMKYLVERPVHNLADLVNQTGLTKRQLDYSLEKVNEFVGSDKIQISGIENGRIVISSKTKDAILTALVDSSNLNDYTMNASERMKFIFLLLFYYYEDYFSINHFTTEFGVGKTTILNDLKSLNVSLAKENIEIIYSRKYGYQIVGNEFDIRYHLMRMIILDSTENHTTFIYDHFIRINNLLSFDETKGVIVPLIEKFSISFVENRLTEFIYTYIFLKKRLPIFVKEGVETFKLASMATMKEYRFSSEVLSLTSVNDTFSTLYLCAWILGLSIGTPDSTTTDYETVLELVKRIIQRVESLSGIRFSNQQLVINQLYAHFRPAYYRLLFKLPIVNPLCSKIKGEYGELFSIVEEALKPISSLLENEIPDEELAFLTMHFASLSANYNDEKMVQKVGLIVCPNGVGSSAIVYTELKTLFPELSFIGPVETNEIDAYRDSYDLVFSTVPNIRLFYTKKPVFLVNPIMNTAEKYRLISDVYSQMDNLSFKLPNVKDIIAVINKHASINNLIALEKELYDRLLPKKDSLKEELLTELNLSNITSPQFIQTGVNARDWEEAIRLSGAPLIKHGKISRQYIEKIISNKKKDGAYMVIAKHIALPHARPSDGVEELAISITSLKLPVKFDSKENDPVKYIFCLAATSDNRHLNAMAELVELLDDKTFHHLLDTSRDPNEIYNYLLKA